VTRRRNGPRSGPFLEAETTVRVRFQEVDSLRMVWHGHYLTYFEEGRTAFGRRYSFGYEDILAAGFIAPLVHIEVDYLKPARYGDVLTVRTRLVPAEGARIDFTYLVAGAAGEPLAAGSSVQLFTELDGTLVLTRPAFVDRILFRHAKEMIEP